MRAGMARYLGIAAMGICVAVSAAAATDTDDKVLLNACWGPAELAAKPGENLSRRGDRRFDAPPTDGWLVTPSETERTSAVGAIRRVTLPPGKKLVALTFEQRGKLRDIIASQSDAQESSAKFKLMIGAKVPEGVPLRPMPQEAVDLVPRYKDFDFAIVKDRIVVVQRSNRSIDTMIPR